LIRSHYIGQLSAEMDGKEVTLAGWVHEVRETGKITFLLLRDRTGVAQIIGKKGETEGRILKGMTLPKESVVKVVGIVKANKEAKAGFEIVPTEITDLNPLSAKIPFEVTGKVPVEIDVRLDYRYIDLRRAKPTAIFNIESTLMNTFLELQKERGFVTIRPPSIIAEASEGGSDLFPIAYFEKEAYLAQSPQIYKQLAVVGGIDKVTMITPVFRAEKSNTVYHLTESTQMDIEMGFADHNDAIKALSETVRSMIKAVKEKNAKDLETLKAPPLEVPEVKEVTYEEVIDLLHKRGHALEFGNDITREHEAAIHREFGEAVIIKEFPAAIRAFYSMPKADNPELTNSFDFIYRGLEISSGAQRIHIPELLIKSLEKQGMDPKKFEFYIHAFRCGAPPHAGWSIGLERFAMRITGSDNIRECSLFPRDRKRVKP
jgi:aspartyl-tRNA synthetase